MTIRNISDTARWVAVYRARESERRDALFHDPYARRLAGERGEQIADSVGRGTDWAFVIRTYLFDRFIREQISAGADTVVNLAAGLDARPYRLDLPDTLRWYEVDLPEIIDYKALVLASDRPRCHLERVSLDLADGQKRLELFRKIGATSRNTLVLTEGLLVYLSAEDVGALATDLRASFANAHWVIDIASPGLLQMLQRNRLGQQLDEVDLPLRFAPPEGPVFFERFGWKVAHVYGSLREAARVKRSPLFLRFLALFPQSPGPDGKRPWSGICLLKAV